MRLVRLPVAGAGGRPVIVNAMQVVCVIDIGDKRSQIVTTGLSGEASISLMVELSAGEVADRLEAAVAESIDRPSSLGGYGKPGSSAEARTSQPA